MDRKCQVCDNIRFNCHKVNFCHRYADRARKIKNKPIVNHGNEKEEVLRLRRENADLKMQLMQAGGSGGGALSGLEAKELVSLRDQYQMVLKENKDLTGALTGEFAVLILNGFLECKSNLCTRK